MIESSDKYLDPSLDSVEAFMSSVVQTNECMIFFDAAGTIRQISREVAELIGHDPEEILGRPLSEALRGSTASVAVLLEALQATRASGSSVQKVIPWRMALERDSGDTLYLELSVSRVALADQTFFLALVRNETPSLELERQLSRSEAVYRELYEGAPVMLHSIDDQGRIISVSDRWLETFGYERREVVGRLSTDFLTEDSRRYARELVLPLFQKEGKIDDVPYQFVCKNGEVRDILLSAISEVHADGRFFRSLAVLVDVTEHNRTEMARRALEAQVFRLQKLESLEVLAAGAAHDFNNILTVILGQAHLAQTEGDDSEQLFERLASIQQAAERAGDICQQMLAFSGQSERQYEPVCLTRLVEEMAAMLEVTVGKKARLKLDLVEDLPRVWGDSTQLRQVLMNLILNSADATEQEMGAIHIRTGSRCDNQASPRTGDAEQQLEPGLCSYVEIEDEGCGMDADTMQRIFDPFFTTKPKGRGLGMAVVFGHIRGHRGTIEVESAPGKGTRICVLLPTSETRDSASEFPDFDSKGERDPVPEDTVSFRIAREPVAPSWSSGSEM